MSNLAKLPKQGIWLHSYQNYHFISRELPASQTTDSVVDIFIHNTDGSFLLLLHNSAHTHNTSSYGTGHHKTWLYESSSSSSADDSQCLLATYRLKFYIHVCSIGWYIKIKLSVELNMVRIWWKEAYMDDAVLLDSIFVVLSVLNMSGFICM